MEKLTVSVEVSKEAYEFGVGLVNIGKSIKTALADGWQPGQDLPVIVLTAVAELPKMIEGMEDIEDEFKASPIATSRAFALAGAGIAGMFIEEETIGGEIS